MSDARIPSPESGTDDQTTEPASPPPPRRWRRRLVMAGVALLVLVLVAEVVARFGLGLGDPPLSVADPRIEYLFKPSSEYQRFGNRVAFNAYSMRSEDFPPRKADPDECRILLMGDSVINGGSLTDQADLASERLRRRLADQLDRPVVVGNISAGSWGPGNLLAYVERFGLFEADVVVIVLSSHDWQDVPTFEPVVGVSPSFPDQAPLSALTEGVSRYLPDWGEAPSPEPEPEPEPTGDAGDALRALVEQVRAAGAVVVVALHAEQGELTNGPQPGHEAFRALLEELAVPIIDLAPHFREAMARQEQPYRDNIHPNAVGQRVIADALEPFLLDHLRAGSDPGP